MITKSGIRKSRRKEKKNVHVSESVKTSETRISVHIF